MTTEILAVIDALNHPAKFYCGIVLWDDKVVVAAPIVKWMKGWTRARVRDHCREKGWWVTVVYQREIGSA